MVRMTMPREPIHGGWSRCGLPCPPARSDAQCHRHCASVAASPGYAELHCLSDFSFGRGASSARELIERAWRCSYTALAITD
jgi:error-prone DNA polymerase